MAAAYRETEVKVKAALQLPVRPTQPQDSAIEKFFGVFSDPRAYTSLLMHLARGIGRLHARLAKACW